MLDISKLVPGETVIRSKQGEMCVGDYVFMGMKKDCINGNDLVLLRHTLQGKISYLAMALEYVKEWEIKYKYSDITENCQISDNGRVIRFLDESCLIGLPPGYIWKKEFVYDKEYLSVMKIKNR
jgi:hypothetical protein